MTAPDPTMIAFDETVTWTVDEWKAYAKRLHGEWQEAARRGVEAEARIQAALARENDEHRRAKDLHDKLAEAARREREACQSECQKVSNLIGATSSDEEHAQGFKDGAEACVNAIRARNEPAASPAAPIGENDEH